MARVSTERKRQQVTIYEQDCCNAGRGTAWGEWGSLCFTQTFFSKNPSTETAVKCKSSLIPESALLMSRGQEAGQEGVWQDSLDPLLQGLFHRPFPPEISIPQ